MTKPKPVKAWAVFDSEGRVTNMYLEPTHPAEKILFGTGGQEVPVLITPIIDEELPPGEKLTSTMVAAAEKAREAFTVREGSAIFEIHCNNCENVTLIKITQLVNECGT